MRNLKLVYLASALVAICANANAEPRVVGAVYTMSNASNGNQILLFDRHGDGTLSAAGAIATGGAGSGGGLGNQGGLVLSDDGRSLLAVNAGSNDLSLFRVTGRRLRQTDLAPSGGIQPVSVTIHEDVAYVLNAGSDSITGFEIEEGHLTPLAGSTQALSGKDAGPAEIAFSPDGHFLIVTEKNTNLIDIFPVGRDGVAGPALSQASNGATPFGFSSGRRSQLFVSEAFGGAADASAVSAYALERDGSLTLISGSVGTNQTAACWVVVTRDGRFAYTSNTGSGSISGYGISRGGAIALLNEDGRTGDTEPDSSPIDLALTGDGRFLYSLNSGTNTIGAFRIARDGQLTALPFVRDLPPGSNGLAAR